MARDADISQLHYISFGSENIPFHLVLRDRQRISISVYPDRRVTVVAPSHRSMDEILARIRRRAPWIIKQRTYFEQFQPLLPERKYVSGETYLYLGRQYRLKILQRKQKVVKLIGRYFYIHTPNRDNTKKIQELLDGWYREHAKDIYAKRLVICLKAARTLGIDSPHVIIRKMVKRWGSCTKAGNIMLNSELIKTPLYCIEYVIMHELCHLRAHNHSKDFYKLIARYMPDWEKRKKRLDRFVL